MSKTYWKPQSMQQNVPEDNWPWKQENLYPTLLNQGPIKSLESVLLILSIRCVSFQNLVLVWQKFLCYGNSIERTGQLSAPDVNSARNNQPRKKAYVGILTRVHPHLPGLTLNQCASGQLLKRLGHRVEVTTEAIMRYTVWRMANAYLHHTAHYQGW